MSILDDQEDIEQRETHDCQNCEKQYIVLHNNHEKTECCPFCGEPLE
ncbi:hypothetical protein SHAb15599_00185 [Acinetobacter phage SH-Ab 15599]|nr:hypothetical protein SHAb15599_00185 [Acinetobacter phage SH-Ab 15599]